MRGEINSLSAQRSAEPSHPSEVIGFGEFRLSPAGRTLTKSGTPVLLGGRAFDMLLALVLRAGQIVSKDELFAIVWPNRFLDEVNLRVHIRALRKALGDGLSGTRFIVNVPGRGYLFAARTARTSGDAQMVNLHGLERPVDSYSAPIPLVRVIGRDEEIDELGILLRRNRFVTITGAGGIGKTTVALAVIKTISKEFRDGVHLVELGSLTGPQVDVHIASQLQLPSSDKAPLQSIVDHLRARNMLLVLDNCEHVIESTGNLAEAILEGAPEVHILATSREPLHAAGEWLRRLGPLPVPPPATSGKLTAAEALRFPAVALFAERAIAVERSCELTDRDAPIVAQLCARLDGLPLAIELAAASIPFIGLQFLVDRLDDRFSILNRGRRTAFARHRTLEAMIEWSYETLSDEEKVAWLRLSVFPDTFSVAAAAAVVGERPAVDIQDILCSLVHKSLVSVELYEGRASYRLLETLRLYAFKELTRIGDAAAARSCHAQYWYERSLEYSDNWTRPPTPDWLGRHSGDISDIRAALKWALSESGDPVLGIRIVVASTPLWFKLMLFHELRSYLDQAIQLVQGLPEIDDALRMRLYTALEYSVFHAQGRASQEPSEDEDALVLAERAGDINAQVQVIWMRWGKAAAFGEYASLTPWVERIEGILAKTPDHPIASLLLGRMSAMTRHFAGDQTTAIEHAEKVINAAAKMRTRRDPALILTHDHTIGANMTYARALWLAGQPERAVGVIRYTIDELCSDLASGGAQASSAQSFSLGFFLMWAACPVSFWVGDLKAARKYVSMLLEVRSGTNFFVLRTTGRAYAQALRFLENDDHEQSKTRDELTRSPELNTFQAESISTFSAKLLCMRPLADALRGEVNWCTAELLRAEGERLVEAGFDNRRKAEALFNRSLEISRCQRALSWELRSSVSLARLWRDSGRIGDAGALLTDVCGRFREGLSTRDLVEAKSLLESLRRAG